MRDIVHFLAVITNALAVIIGLYGLSQLVLQTMITTLGEISLLVFFGIGGICSLSILLRKENWPTRLK